MARWGARVIWTLDYIYIYIYDDEKTSQVSVSKDPYYQIYHYPQDWFAHDEENPED